MKVKENHLFLGWFKDSSLTVPYTDYEMALSNFGGEEAHFYAKWEEKAPGEAICLDGTHQHTPYSNHIKNGFYVRGVQIREQDSEMGQALRFIVRIDTENLFANIKNINLKNGFMAHPDAAAANGSQAGYGMVIASTVVLGDEELRLGGSYSYNGKTYLAQDVRANKKVGTTCGMIDYTLALTNIKTAQMKTGFTVRPYIRYYTASGQLVTVYGEAYSVSMYDAALYIYCNGDETEATYDYIHENVIYPVDGVTYTSKLLKDSVETQAQTMKNNILNAANISASGQVYYVSNSGNSGNNGTSESTPWDYATLQENLQNGGFLGTIQSGSTILFKRGEVFRGNIVIDASIGSVSNLTLSAYGEGNKPIITTSPANLAGKTWTAVDGYPNVYECEGTYVNVGNMVFNTSMTRYNTTDELQGFMYPYGYGKYKGIETLEKDLQFYNNLDTESADYGKLYLYSTEGNPADRFNSIEIGVHGNIINVNNQTGITISNLDIRYGGSHGIATGNANNLTVENCVFSYIGGSVHGGHGNTTLFGNAVEAYGDTSNFVVRNNWIYQIYDTAITQQNNQAAKDMENATWSSNLIEHTHWPVEFWNYYNGECTMTGLTISDNIIRTTGYGFGSMTRANLATCIDGTRLEGVSNINITNNIFDRTKGYFTMILDEEADKMVFSDNTYIAEAGVKGLSWYGEDQGFNLANKGSSIKDLLGDSTAKIYFYK